MTTCTFLYINKKNLQSSSVLEDGEKGDGLWRMDAGVDDDNNNKVLIKWDP